MGNRGEKARTNLLRWTRRPRRTWPFLVFIVPVLILGYTLYDAARPVALGSLIEARERPSAGSVAGYYSSAKTAEAARTPSVETSTGLSDIEVRRKLDILARTRLPSPPPSDTCDDLMVLVDREHHLPPGYEPPNLVSVEAHGAPMYGGEMMLRRGAAEQLGRMVRAASAAGEEIMVSSAYRSYAHQGVVFTRLVSIYGEEQARWTSAPPGQSQHQLGTAVDFTNSAVGYKIHKAFGHTTASAWLMEHAPEYGFALSYPNYKEAETGYRWEPWHYRYIGVENARSLEEDGITLQEFLTREGVEPRC